MIAKERLLYILQTTSDVDPLEYGPSARGKLTEFVMSKGGKTLGNCEPIGELSDMLSIQYTRQTMDAAVATGRPLIFDLRYMKDISGVLNGTAYPDSTTSFE